MTSRCMARAALAGMPGFPLGLKAERKLGAPAASSTSARKGSSTSVGHCLLVMTEGGPPFSIESLTQNSDAVKVFVALLLLLCLLGAYSLG